MATRMTALLDVEQAERVDSGESGPRARLTPETEGDAVAPAAPQATGPLALPTLTLALTAIAAVFLGLATWGIAIAWSASMTGLVLLAVTAVGTYFLVVGAALVMLAPPSAA